MSRYMSQLARETRSKLRPLARFPMAQRAAVFGEVHEERVISTRPEPRESAVAAPPAVVAESRGVLATNPPRAAERPIGYAPSPVSSPEGSFAPPLAVRSKARAVEMQQATAAKGGLVAETVRGEQAEELSPFTVEQRADAAVAEERAIRPAQPIAEVVQRLETLFFAEETTERPPAAAWQGAVRSVLPEPQQTSIDVTIGRIEVTIEGERPAPLRMTRAAARPGPKPVERPGVGRLARLYLDR